MQDENNLLFQNLSSPIEHFYNREKGTPDKVWMRQPYGDTWKEITWGEAGQMARRLATALQGLGLKKGDHVAMISKNCHHLIISDLAIMMAGCVSVPLYATLNAEEFNVVLGKSGAKALFVGKLDEWSSKEKYVEEGMPVIRFPHYQNCEKINLGHDWDELLNSNSPMTESPVPQMDELWSILFSSGTTGSPKGVMHSQENAALVIRNEEFYNDLGLNDVKNPKILSYLPFNHIADRVYTELFSLGFGTEISFVESIDTFAKNLKDTSPTVFGAVPRIWTKLYSGILAKVPQKKLDLLLKIPIVSGFIKNKIKNGIGIDKSEIFITGSAITPANIKNGFAALGIELRELYGMTETLIGVTNSPKSGDKNGTVGKPIANAEVKIDPDTSEILMSAPWIMKGYYNDPEQTAEILKDGWIYSGDKGTMDSDGFVRVIGRVKDTFKTTKGEYIVPTLIEGHFDNEYIEQICVAGLGIPQPIALVNLSEKGLQEDKTTVNSSIIEELDKVNTKLAGHERISTLIVTKDIWSVENKLLTPTMKIKRGKLDEKYGPSFFNWHEDSDKLIWE